MLEVLKKINIVEREFYIKVKFSKLSILVLFRMVSLLKDKSMTIEKVQQRNSIYNHATAQYGELVQLKIEFILFIILNCQIILCLCFINKF